MTHTPRIERERRLLHQHEVPELPHPEARHLSDNTALRDRQYDILQHIQETLDNPQTRDTFFHRLFGLFDGNNGQTFMDRLRTLLHGTHQPQTPTTQPLTQLPVQQIPNVPTADVRNVPEMVRKEFEDRVRAIPLPQGVTITTCTPEVVIISYKNNTENVWLTQPGNVDSIRTALPEMARRLVSRVDGTPLAPQQDPPRDTPPQDVPPQNPPTTPENPPQTPETTETSDEFRAKVEAAPLLPYVTVTYGGGRTYTVSCLGQEQTYTVDPGADVTQSVTAGIRIIRYNTDRRIDSLRDTLTLPDGMTVAAAETPPYWQLRYRDQTQQVDVFAVPLTQLVEHAQSVATEFKQRIDATPDTRPPETPPRTPETADEFRAKVEAATLLPYVTVARIEDRTVVLACVGEEQSFTIAAGADVTQEVTDAVRVMRYTIDRRIDALRDTVPLQTGLTIAADETPPYWQFRYRGQTQQVDVFSVPLTRLVARAETEGAEFKQRVDATPDTRPRPRTPDTREAEPNAEIVALRAEITTLAETTGIAAEGVDAHVAAIREKVQAVNALIATQRSASGGRFRPQWEGRLIAARPTLNINYIGDDQTGQVEVTELTLHRVPGDFADARRERNASAEEMMKNGRHFGMGTLIANLLNEMGPKTSGDYTFEPVPADNTTGYKFRIVVRSGGSTETWYVSRPNTSQVYDSDDLIIWKAAPDGSCDRRIQAYIEGGIFTIKLGPDGKLQAVMHTDWTRTFDQYRRIANFNRQSEERDAAEMLPHEGRPGFDLPKNRPVAALQLFGLQYDGPNFQRGRSDFSRLIDTLSSQGYHIVPSASGLSQDIEATNPLTIIEQTIQQNLALGITDLYLSIDCHGSQSGTLVFPKGPKASDGRWRVRYEEMMQIFRRYPQMHVTIDSCACYGGWGTTPDQDPDNAASMPYTALIDNRGATEGRITVVTHTISTSSNITGSHYSQFLEYYLAQGKPYGEAHMLADSATQVHIGFNPGVRRSSGFDSGYVETAREPVRLIPEGEQYI